MWLYVILQNHQCKTWSYKCLKTIIFEILHVLFTYAKCYWNTFALGFIVCVHFLTCQNNGKWLQRDSWFLYFWNCCLTFACVELTLEPGLGLRIPHFHHVGAHCMTVDLQNNKTWLYCLNGWNGNTTSFWQENSR